MREKLIKRNNIRRVLSFILCIVMSLSLMPVTAKADGLTVQNITWNDTVLSWDPVEGAIEYNISMNGQSMDAYSTSVDCKKMIRSTGTYTPTITAYGENEVVIAETVGPSKDFEVVKLATPSNIQVDGNVVSWDAVPNASEYCVHLYEWDEANSWYGATIKYIYVTKNSTKLTELITNRVLEGYTYRVSVEAFDTNGNYGDSEAGLGDVFTYQGIVLPSIENIKWGTGDNSKVLSWDPVEGAIEYNISMNGQAQSTSETSLNCKSFIRSTGTYTPTITAYDKDNEAIATSEGTPKDFVVPKLSTPSNIQVVRNVITWDAVPNASEYYVELTCEGIDSFEYTRDIIYVSTNETTISEIDIYNVIEEGKAYRVEIKAVNSEGDYGESDLGFSARFVYEILYDVTTSVVGDGGTISESALIRNHENYEVVLTPEEGYVISYLKINGTDVTSKIVNNKYTIANITSDKNVEASFSTCNHNWNAGVVTSEATCKVAGEKTYTCSTCGDTKTETVPKLINHTWNDGEVYAEATCGNTGSKKYTCTVCAITKNEVIPATNNHNYGEFTVILEPTCGKEGIKSHTCIECEKDNEEAIPATGEHNFVDKVCSVCKIKECVATGEHDYSEYVSNSNGTHKIMCKYCEATQEGHESDACSGGAATYTQRAVCSKCAAGYGDFLPKPNDSTSEGETGTGTGEGAGTGTETGTGTGSGTSEGGNGIGTGTGTGTETGTGTGTVETVCEHTYGAAVVTKATTSKNGSSVSKCTKCGDEKKETIYAAKSIVLAKTEYTYDGKVKKPAVTVKDSKGNKIASSNYTVTYASGRKAIGEYKVTVKFKGNYSGSKTLKFKIVPKTTTVSKATPGSKKLTVAVKKITSNVNGYEIQIATDSKFTKGVKKATLTKNTKTSTTFKSLKKGTKYYVRVRTYKTVGKTKIYSGWKTYSKQVKIK